MNCKKLLSIVDTIINGNLITETSDVGHSIAHIWEDDGRCYQISVKGKVIETGLGPILCHSKPTLENILSRNNAQILISDDGSMVLVKNIKRIEIEHKVYNVTYSYRK